jgi:hypothetical protein
MNCWIFHLPVSTVEQHLFKIFWNRNERFTYRHVDPGNLEGFQCGIVSIRAQVRRSRKKIDTSEANFLKQVLEN